MAPPIHRLLRGYSLDPGFSTRLDTAAINEVVYAVPFEPLQPGPTGEYVEVVDFDPASNCWYDPVDLSREDLATQNGHPPSEGNPQFHQQFVYAVVMKTIDHFEQAMGRKLVWYPRALVTSDKRRADDDARTDREYVQRLRIYPHAMREANAYYDPDKRSLLFGYFTAARQVQGANYPGGIVFTCLSPDIVAHETTHAILDSIHHRYLEDTNLDVAAFHEGFADIVALLQRFTFTEMVEHQLFATAGHLDGPNVLGQLATQFGEAIEGNHGALRSMIGNWNDDKWIPKKPRPSDYLDNTEAHDRGAVLVATVFDAFQRLYQYRTADLIRLATSGTGVLPAGSISRDLVHRLAGEAEIIAEHLLHVCIRALDYCPPHDITFGDYLRALITADVDIAPEDEGNYRLALIEAFRARGILPDRVNTLSVESLTWNAPILTAKQEKAINKIVHILKPQIQALVEAEREQVETEGIRRKIYELSLQTSETLEAGLKDTPPEFSDDEWEDLLNKFGLTSLRANEIFEHGFDDTFVFNGRRNDRYRPRIEVQTFRPAFRVSRREGKQVDQVLVTLTQRVSTLISKGKEPPRRMVFRGGCTMILDLGNRARVKYLISKNIRNLGRYKNQRDYLRGEKDASAAVTSLYSDDDRNWRLNFNLLHQHLDG